MKCDLQLALAGGARGNTEPGLLGLEFERSGACLPKTEESFRGQEVTAMSD